MTAAKPFRKALITRAVLLLSVLFVVTASASSQNVTPGITQVGSSSGRSASEALPSSLAPHRFWDRENDLLFAGVGASRAFDYASTLNIRRRGLNEALLTNEIVDNHPLFAGIEAAGTAASIGVSYLFHRTGHHKLERWVSVVHIGVATGGALRNYALKTPQHR